MTQEEHLERIADLSAELPTLVNHLADIIEKRNQLERDLSTARNEESDAKNRIEKVKSSLLKLVEDVK